MLQYTENIENQLLNLTILCLAITGTSEFKYNALIIQCCLRNYSPQPAAGAELILLIP